MVVVMRDPFHRSETVDEIGAQLREIGSRVLDLLVERVDRAPPIELDPVAPRATRLAAGRRVAFVSLVAGAGTTSLAALVAQRAGGAGARVRLIDLDVIAPTLALLAGSTSPTVTDVLATGELRGRRWGSVEAVYGSALDVGAEAGPAFADLIQRLAKDAAVVVDAGSLAAPVTDAVLRACDTVVYVTSARGAHVHAATRARRVLESLRVAPRLAVTRATDDAAALIARELGLPLAGAVPEDPFLARDEYRVRAETARAVDLICASLASR